MNIQTGAELSINLKGQKSIITAYYVGEKDRRHIVLTFSEDQSEYFKKSKDLIKITAQYSDNGVRYEFSSRILDVLDEPVHLALLEYPSETLQVNKRSSDRINCLISTRLESRPEKDSSPMGGVIKNINKTGCLCILNTMKDEQVSFSKGDRINLTCQFPGLVGEQSACGRVVRILKDKKDIVIGIHFDEKIWWVPPYERK